MFNKIPRLPNAFAPRRRFCAGIASDLLIAQMGFEGPHDAAVRPHYSLQSRLGFE